MAVCSQCYGAGKVPRFPAYATPTFALANNEKPCDQCQGTGQAPIFGKGRDDPITDFLPEDGEPRSDEAGTIAD